MHSYQETQITFPISLSRPLQAISAVWDRTSKRLQESLEAARQERVVSKLSLHLRQDTGDIDCRPPPPRPLSETLGAHQQTLEGIWLRQF